MTADAANPRFGSVARLSFGMPKNAVQADIRPRKPRSTQGGGNPLPMVADWKFLSNRAAYVVILFSEMQHLYKRDNTLSLIRCDSICLLL